MLTNKTIGGEEIVSELDYLFNADFRRLNFVQDSALMIEVRDSKLIDHNTFTWKQNDNRLDNSTFVRG